MSGSGGGGIRNLAGRVLHSDLGIAAIIAYFYLMGLIGHYLPLTRGYMPQLTPWFLLIAGVIVVAPFWREAGRVGRIWFLVTYLITFFLEVLGVATGEVFGAYVYGTALGYHILDVPFIIGFNWVLVILGFLRGTQRLFIRAAAAERLGAKVLLYIESAALPAAAALLFDYIMEPVAIELEYWIWAGGEIPLQNYMAWFLIALAASLFYRLMRITFSSRLPLYYAFIQVLFFLGLYGL